MFSASSFGFRTPRKKLYVWIVSVIVFLSMPIFTILYYFDIYDKGAYPIDGDSITVPIFHNLVGLAVLFPFFCGFLYFSTRNYIGNKSLVFWNHDRPYWSIGWSVFFIALILVNLMGIPYIWELRLFTEGVKLLIICWFFLYLRAVVIAKPKGVVVEIDNESNN